MATPKFYKKLFPTTKVRMSNGSQAEFASIDGVVGFYSTDSEYVQDQFLQMMSQQRYGLTEISFEEFSADYIEKKTQPMSSAPNWREELSKSTPRIRSLDPVERLGGEYLQRAVAVNSLDDIRRNNIARVAPLPATRLADAADAPPEPKKVFTPTVGKRKPLKK